MARVQELGVSFRLRESQGHTKKGSRTGIDVRVDGVDAVPVHREAKSGRLGHRAHAPGAVSILFGEVASDVDLRGA